MTPDEAPKPKSMSKRHAHAVNRVIRHLTQDRGPHDEGTSRHAAIDALAVLVRGARATLKTGPKPEAVRKSLLANWPGNPDSHDFPPVTDCGPDPIPEPCLHCLMGEGEHSERWSWSLIVTTDGGGVHLSRDGVPKLAVPLTADQISTLMDKPTTLQGVLADGI